MKETAHPLGDDGLPRVVNNKLVSDEVVWIIFHHQIEGFFLTDVFDGSNHVSTNL